MKRIEFFVVIIEFTEILTDYGGLVDSTINLSQDVVQIILVNSGWGHFTPKNVVIIGKRKGAWFSTDIFQKTQKRKNLKLQSIYQIKPLDDFIFIFKHYVYFLDEAYVERGL